MSTHYTRKKINILGHKNPDTDSICAALSYCWYKRQTDPEGEYEARRCGSVNRESQFVLNYWKAAPPRLCTSVSPQMKDIDFRLQPGIDGEMSIRSAWSMMREQDIETLCIVNEENELKGLISITDVANANMNLLDNGILADADTSYKNLIETLEAELITGDAGATIYEGHIFIGSSPEIIEDYVGEGDIVLVSNRYEAQICAIECGASCVIICCGAPAGRSILNRAKEKHCTILTTPFDTYVAARLISTAIPVRHIMHSQNILQFGVNTYVEDARKIMASVRHRYFPILDKEGRYAGVVSRRNMLNVHPKRVILVDHNEFTQTEDGMEQAEILEIIDHHRIGNLETGAPAYFRNEPVGCTNTIIWTMMQEKGLTPPKKIAGLMLSAILSDTLCFRSPTCTSRDVNAAEALAKLAEVDIESYANQMFEAGEDLKGRTAEDIFYGDFKLFTFGDLRFGVSQSTFMTEKNRREAERMVREYLPEAAMKSGVEMIFYMATDTPSSSTELFWYGDEAEEYLRRAFRKDADPGGYFNLPGVVSRKKQLIPPLRMAMQSEA